MMNTPQVLNLELFKSKLKNDVSRPKVRYLLKVGYVTFRLSRELISEDSTHRGARSFFLNMQSKMITRSKSVITVGSQFS